MFPHSPRFEQAVEGRGGVGWELSCSCGLRVCCCGLKLGWDFENQLCVERERLDPRKGFW